MYTILQAWRDGVTGDIYQFIPVLILLGILLYFIARMLSAASSSAGGAAPSTGGMSRRSIVSGAIWTAVGAVLVASIYPKIGDEFASQTPSYGCLLLESDTTHTIKSHHNQHYDCIEWQETGALEWEDGGRLTLHEAID